MSQCEAPASPVLRLLSVIRSKRSRRNVEPCVNEPRRSKKIRQRSGSLKEWRSELALVEREDGDSTAVQRASPQDMVLAPAAHVWSSPCRTRRLTVAGVYSAKQSKVDADTKSSTEEPSPVRRRRSLSDLDDMRRLAAKGFLGKPFVRGAPLRRSRQTEHLPTCSRSCYDERVLVVGSRRDTTILFPSRCGPVIA